MLENIFKQIEEKGMDPQEAAIAGTREIGLAVLATTLSLIAVFLPIAFVAGIPGRFLASFGITMSILHRRVAVRQLHADADAGVAVAEGEEGRATTARRCSSGWWTSFYRPIERGYGKLLALLHAAPLAHRGRLAC